MSNLAIVEYDNRRVLTSNQLAEAYETDTQLITNNFNRNKKRYLQGKHYYGLEGAEKQAFINQNQIDLGSKNAKVIYLWTQNGTLLHAKSLNTDKAWEVYQNLVDFYFNVKENTNTNTPSSNLSFMEATVNELKAQAQHIQNNDEKQLSLMHDIEKQEQTFNTFRENMGKMFKLVDRRLTNAEDVTNTLLDQVEKLKILKNTIGSHATLGEDIIETPQLPINPIDEMLNTTVQYYERLRTLATVEDGFIGDRYVVTFKRLLGRFKNKRLILKNGFDEQTIFENFQYEYHEPIEYDSSKSFAYFLLKCNTTGIYKRIFVCDIEKVKGKKLFLTDSSLKYELF